MTTDRDTAGPGTAAFSHKGTCPRCGGEAVDSVPRELGGYTAVCSRGHSFISLKKHKATLADESLQAAPAAMLRFMTTALPYVLQAMRNHRETDYRRIAPLQAVTESDAQAALEGLFTAMQEHGIVLASAPVLRQAAHQLDTARRHLEAFYATTPLGTVAHRPDKIDPTE